MLEHALALRGLFSRPGIPLTEVLATDPVAYREIAAQNVVTSYIAIASMMIVFWDWALSLDDEIKYIWQRRSKSSGKPLYLFLRYGGTVFQVFGAILHLRGWSASFCTKYYIVEPIGTAVLLSILDILLAYRVLCLNRMKRSLVILNIIFYILCCVLFAVLVGVGYKGFGGIDTPEGMTGCFATIGSWIIFLSCVPALLFETWLFGLTLYRVAAFSRATRRKLPEVLRLLLKDWIRWFFIITSLIVWNAVSLLVAPTGSHTIAISPIQAAITVCGCRLILRMRKVAAQGGDPFVLTNGNGVARTQNDDSEWSHDLPDQQSSSAAKNKFADRHIERHRKVELRPASSAPSSSSSVRVVTAKRFVGIAQKLGLPPPLSSDFDELWHEPRSFLDLDEDSPPAESVHMEPINVSKRISLVPEPRQSQLIPQLPAELSDIIEDGKVGAAEQRDDDGFIVFSRPANPYSERNLSGRHSSIDV